MKYTYNKEYLMRDEKPWFPVMGEFHYSRYRDDLWEESLRKMKAGGVTVVESPWCQLMHSGSITRKRKVCMILPDAGISGNS